jgi:UDP-N-acetylglucosamine--N-acetylmuramyl-(pentapeptide) pyrophosphoryl-undecaprenol N-acetylglucosamine transferase
VYPALAVLQALENDPPQDDELSVLWIGSEGGMEAELVKRAGVTYETIPAAGVHGVGLRKLPGNLLLLVQGYLKAKEILRKFDPQVLFFTGGYVAVPVAIAGRSLPTMLFVPDIEPGLALRLLSRFSRRIALSVADTKSFFKRHPGTLVTGYPVRPDLQVLDKHTAQKSFHLSSELPVLMVVGGSSGARSINRALLQILPELLKMTQVIHISGKLDWPEVTERRMKLLQNAETADLVSSRYRVFDFLHEDMGAAYSAADLVLSRAGASILGELPLFGLPAILVPYPFAWHYQKVNAEYLADRGAARILPDQELHEQLAGLIQNLLTNKVVLSAMSQSMRNLAHPLAASTIASSIIELGRQANRRLTEP